MSRPCSNAIDVILSDIVVQESAQSVPKAGPIGGWSQFRAGHHICRPHNSQCDQSDVSHDDTPNNGCEQTPPFPSEKSVRRHETKNAVKNDARGH
jgi:hypothetical protein